MAGQDDVRDVIIVGGGAAGLAVRDAGAGPSPDHRGRHRAAGPPTDSVTLLASRGRALRTCSRTREEILRYDGEIVVGEVVDVSVSRTRRLAHVDRLAVAVVRLRSPRSSARCPRRLRIVAAGVLNAHTARRGARPG